MVLTIEPGMEYAQGKMIVHEENVVIRKDGAELITKRALLVINSAPSLRITTFSSCTIIFPCAYSIPGSIVKTIFSFISVLSPDGEMVVQLIEDQDHVQVSQHYFLQHFHQK